MKKNKLEQGAVRIESAKPRIRRGDEGEVYSKPGFVETVERMFTPALLLMLHVGNQNR